MSNDSDPGNQKARNQEQVEAIGRRGFLRSFLAGVGGFALGGEAFGQSLLLRKVDRVRVLLPCTTPTTLSTSNTVPWSYTIVEGSEGTNSRSYTIDGPREGTETFSGIKESYSFAYSYTLPKWGQTITIHRSDSRIWTPPPTYVGTRSFDGTVVTQTLDWPAQSASVYVTETYSGTYTTTTGCSNEVEPTEFSFDNGDEPAHDVAILSVDLPRDLGDLRTRRGQPFDLDLVR